MFSYTFSKCADNQAFKSACAIIEAALPIHQKGKLLIDVDGSLIQIYCHNGREIKVFNDYEVDAVYVDSEVELSGIFGEQNES